MCHAETSKSLSKQGGDGGDFSALLYTSEEVSKMQLGSKLNAADSYTIMATINLIRSDNSI